MKGGQLVSCEASQLDHSSLRSHLGYLAPVNEHFKISRWVGPLAMGVMVMLWMAHAFQGLIPGAIGMYNDDGIYALAAQDLARGHGYRSPSGLLAPYRYPPFYPLVLAPLWSLFGTIQEFDAAACSLNILLTVASGFLIAHYFRRGLKWAWPSVLGGVAAFMGQTMVLEFAGSVLSEPLFIFLMLVAIVGVAVRQERSVHDARGYLGLGLIVGLAVLTRYAGLSVVAALGLWAILEKRWKPLLAACLGFLVVWGPWVLFRWLEPGEPYVTNFFRSMGALGLSGGAPRALALSGSLSLVQALPGFFWDRWAHVLPVDPGARVLGWLAIVAGGFIALAIIHAVREAFRPETASLDRLAALLVGFTVLMDIVWSSGYAELGSWQHARLLVPILPFLFQILVRPWHSARPAPAWRPAVALWVIAAVAFVSSNEIASLRNAVRFNHVTAMDDVLAALHLIARPEDIIVTRYPPLVSMRSGLRTLQWSQNHQGMLSTMARYRRVWLMTDFHSMNLDWDSLVSWNPQVAFLSAFNRAYPGVLRIAYRHPETGVCLYHVDRLRLLAAMRRIPPRRSSDVRS